MDKPEHRITYSDIVTIISSAKTQCATQTLPMKVSKKVVLDNDPAQVAMIDTVLTYLNGKGLLNTFVRIDYDEK